MYYDGGQMGTGGWVFMALIMLVLVGLFVAFVVWLTQDQRRRSHRDPYLAGVSASEILDRRLATGEMSVEEYERLKASLTAPAPRPDSRADPPSEPKA